MNYRRFFCMIVPLFVFHCVQDVDKPLVVVSADGVACDVCHGTNNQSVMQTGKHAQHGPSGVYGGSLCEDCHPDNRLGHTVIDGIVKMQDGKSLDSTSTCKGCHGNGASLAKAYWKKPAGSWRHDGWFCESCHDGSSVVKSRTAPNVTAHYLSSGHGHSSKFVQTLHGRPGPGYACVICHDPDGSGHFNGRAGDSLLRIGNGSSALCLDCHTPGQTGPGRLGLSAFSKASKHSSLITGHYSYNYECDVCHDPHGTSNLAMVRNSIDGRLGAGPVATTFTDTTMFDPSTSDSLGNFITVNAVCNACHAPGKDAHGNTEHPGNHRFGRACWQCHFHSVSFDTVGFFTSLLIDPNPAQLSVNASLQLTAYSVTNLNQQTDVSASAQWRSGNPLIVTVDASGNVTGVAAGTAFVYAAYAGFSDSAAVQVAP